MKEMKKITILFVAVIAMMAMTGCNEKKTLETLNGEWSVTTIGEMAVPDSVDAFIGFNLEEKTIYGSTGCNQLTCSLPAEISAEVPLFAAMGSTRMMCADMTIEDAILQMNLLGHSFFFFVNTEREGKPCVVYQRSDGGYGLLVAEI